MNKHKNKNAGPRTEREPDTPQNSAWLTKSTRFAMGVTAGVPFDGRHHFALSSPGRCSTFLPTAEDSP